MVANDIDDDADDSRVTSLLKMVVVDSCCSG